MMDTPAIELNLSIDFEQDSDLKQNAQFIEERLGQLEMVEEVEALPGSSRFSGVEIVAAIGVTVLVVRGSREIIEELRKLIPPLKELISEIKGIKSVFVESGDKCISLAEVNEDDPEQLKALTRL